MEVTVIDRQNPLDIAIQEYGDVSAAFQIALANGISITDELIPGETLEITENPELIDPDVLNYYQTFKVQPVTANEQNTNTIVTPTGIGSMTIKENFIVR